MKTLLIFIYLFIGSCVYSQVTVLHINPDNALGGSASQIFDSVRFIPLETTKESLFGKIFQLEVTEKYFIILDLDTRAILFFDKQGRFKHKIKPNNNPDRFVGYFTLNREKNLLIDLTATNAVSVYDFDGNFIMRKVLPFYCMSLFYLKNGTFLYNTFRMSEPSKKDTIEHDLVYSKGYDAYFKYSFPYNSKYIFNEMAYNENPFNEGASGTAMLYRAYDYTMYQINDTGIVQRYKFVFPLNYSIPSDFESDHTYSGKRRNYFNQSENREKIIHPESFYKIDNYLLFATRQTFQAQNYIYNLTTGNLISLNRVSSDSSSYFLPLQFYFDNARTVFNSHIYSSIPAFILIKDKNETTRTVNYSSTLDHFFNSNERLSNPILLDVKLKPNL